MKKRSRGEFCENMRGEGERVWGERGGGFDSHSRIGLGDLNLNVLAGNSSYYL